MGLFSPKLSTKRMAHLCYRLSSLTKGGVPIVRTLQLLVDGPHARPYRSIFLPVIDSLRTGDTLGEALRTQSKYLPDLFIETVVAGELSGKLDVVLDDLNRHYERVLYLQRLYVRGATYPILVILTAVVIIPYVQGLVLSLDSVEVYTFEFLWAMLRSYGPPFLGILVLARLGLLRKVTDPVFSRIWPIAGFWHRFALARFCRCMGIMLGAGLSARQSIERAAAVTTHPQLKRALSSAVPLVQQGYSLDEALRSTNVFPEMVGEMVHIGELAGRDEELFYKSAEYLYNEAVYPVHTIGIGLTSYLILVWFVLFAVKLILGWVLLLLVQSFGAIGADLFAG